MIPEAMAKTFLCGVFHVMVTVRSEAVFPSEVMTRERPAGTSRRVMVALEAAVASSSHISPPAADKLGVALVEGEGWGDASGF